MQQIMLDNTRYTSQESEGDLQMMVVTEAISFFQKYLKFLNAGIDCPGTRLTAAPSLFQI